MKLIFRIIYNGWVFLMLVFKFKFNKCNIHIISSFLIFFHNSTYIELYKTHSLYLDSNERNGLKFKLKMKKHVQSVFNSTPPQKLHMHLSNYKRLIRHISVDIVEEKLCL